MEIIVKPGETLSQIALQHKVKQQDIVTLNKIPNANKIYAGQKLKMPDIQGTGNPADIGTDTFEKSTQSKYQKPVGLSPENSRIFDYANQNPYDSNNKTYMQNFIKQKEELRLTAYDDKHPKKVLKSGDKIEGKLTVGYGHTGKVDDKPIEIGTVITEQKAKNLMDTDISQAQDIVKNKVKVPLTQNQFDALTSLAFNCPSAFKSEKDSTLLRKLNSGDYKGASEEFPRWNKSGGEPMVGLTNRRKAEKELFLKGLPN